DVCSSDLRIAPLASCSDCKCRSRSGTRPRRAAARRSPPPAPAAALSLLLPHAPAQISAHASRAVAQSTRCAVSLISPRAVQRSRSCQSRSFLPLHRGVDGGVDAIRILVPQVQPLGNFPIPQPPIPIRILPQALDLPNSALVMPRSPRPAVVGVGAGSGFVDRVLALTLDLRQDLFIFAHGHLPGSIALAVCGARIALRIVCTSPTAYS